MSGIPRPNACRVILASPLPPPYTGVEVLASLCLQAPLGDGFVVEAPFPPRPRKVAEKGAFTVQNIVRTLKEAAILWRNLARPGPRLVFTNMVQNAGGLLRYGLFILLARLRRVPVAALSLGDGFRRSYDAAPAWLRAWTRLLMRCVDRIVIHAHGLETQYVDLIPDSRWILARPGLDRPGDLPDRRDRPRLRICFIGYLTRAKGAHDLVRAALEILRTRDVEFHFIGDQIPKERNITYVQNPADNALELQRLLCEPRDPRLVFHGPLGDLDKWRVLMDSDIFTLPSLSEALPVSMLEAMACGLPVVMTPVGGIPNTVTEGIHALFVPPGNHDRLKEALLRLIDDPALRRRMGEACRTLHESRHTLAAYGAELRKAFEEVLEGSARRHSRC